MPGFQRVFIVLLALSALPGCYRMKLQLVDASVQKPSNVAVYFSMDDRNGNPAPGVTADRFQIYEDGKLISTYESQQTILNQEVAIERYTLLLLDMSGSVVDSGQVPQVQEAVGAFLENIGDNEKIAIYAFDGREEIIPIAKFGVREEALARRNELLSSYEPKDPSTNLNGAIVKGVEVLKDGMDDSDVPLRFGTMAIFTDGTDRAHRATSEDAMNALEDNNIRSFVIGLGGEVDTEEMQRFGRDGFVHAQDKGSIVDSFKKVADQINSQALRYYLFSYCSPSRAGTHELTVMVEVASGDKTDKGRLKYTFDAEGFEPGCDPTDTPKFEIPDESEQTAEDNRKKAEEAKADPKKDAKANRKKEKEKTEQKKEKKTGASTAIKLEEKESPAPETAPQESAAPPVQGY